MSTSYHITTRVKAVIIYKEVREEGRLEGMVCVINLRLVYSAKSGQKRKSVVVAPNRLESSRRCQRALLSTSVAYSAGSSRRKAERRYGNHDAREQSNGRSSMASQRDGNTNPRRSGRGRNGNKYMDGNPERTNACVGDSWRSTRTTDALASRTIHKKPTVR